ncbi:MAG TPA: CBS domain-containing protein [Thermoanaerobaculia bacterium]|nr:CBS domain-containing protein [Thermoanaerobaculia bacterium]
MRIAELMTRDPACCTPETPARKAARAMAEKDCGCLPVVDEGHRVIGTVTDRDLACRCVAEGKDAETPVRDLMTANPSCCGADDDVAVAEKIMKERQVRRVPVVDHAGCCIGIVAQADLARHVKADIPERELASVVQRISEPA